MNEIDIIGWAFIGMLALTFTILLSIKLIPFIAITGLGFLLIKIKNMRKK